LCDAVFDSIVCPTLSGGTIRSALRRRAGHPP
jgi:hypothetical protein